MKSEPIRPARIDVSDAAAPFAVDFSDIYHPRAGALQQARHVFLAGNGLPERWRGRESFVVLETGFGLGNNFLATWEAWRRDTQAPRRLHFISIERHPPTRDAMRAVPRDAVLAPLAKELADAWPPLTFNIHRLAFEGGRVELLLALGDVQAWLPEIVARVDAFYLDGFAPPKNPQMWQPRLFKAMARLAAPGATAATWTAARAVRDGLGAAGFEVQRAEGSGGKRDITLARFAPRFVPRKAPARAHDDAPARGHALVVGAGLAGCAVAHAFAEQGWTCTVFDRQARPAQEASGNPAGVFHGIVNAHDGPHARFNRTAALMATAAIGQALAGGDVRGNIGGLLRLDTSGRGPSAMATLLDALGLPPDYVRMVDFAEGSTLSGLPLRDPAWFYPGGGWVQPAAWAAQLLDTVSGAVRFRGACRVAGLHRQGARWQLHDEQGLLLDEGDAVVLANAGDAARLLGAPAWPLQALRGQLSMTDSARLPMLPRVPVTGSGYVLPALESRVVFGATSAPDDFEPRCRDSDHASNLAQLAALADWRIDIPPAELRGRVAWRWVTPDRLPLAGAVPDWAAVGSASRLDQPRLVPRVPGLYVMSALGSRGIAWCSLGARVVAALASGAPTPLEASLLDAIDPARFASREARRGQAAGPLSEADS